jgi:hypothetical protein
MSELFDHHLAELAGRAGAAAQPPPAGSIRRLARHRTAWRTSTAGLLTVAALGAASFGLLHQVSGHPALPLGSPTPTWIIPPDTTPPSTPLPNTSPIPNTSPYSPMPHADPPATCTLAQLTVSGHSPAGLAGSGHRGFVLVFTNKGPTCRMYGYPGVDALDRHGAVVEHAKRTWSGYLGGMRGVGPDHGPQVMDFTAGTSVSTIVEALAFHPSDGGSCTPYASLLVTPPNETHSVRIPWDNDGCSTLEVHPVVSGTTGRLY